MRNHGFKLRLALALLVVFTLGLVPLLAHKANAAQTDPNTCTLTFTPGTGTGTPYSVTVEKDAYFALPTTTSFTKENARLYGWLVGGVEYIGSNNYIYPTADTEIKAIWCVTQTIDNSVDKSTTEVLGSLTITDTTTGAAQTITTYDEVTASEFTQPSNPSVNVMIEEAKDASTARAAEIAAGAEVTIVEQAVSNLTITKNQTPEYSGSLPTKQADGDYSEILTIDGAWCHSWKYTVTTTATYASPYTVSFNPGTGTGEMAPVKVAPGSQYELPACTFTKENSSFYRWLVNGEEIAAGSEITVNANTEVTAVWLDNVTIDNSRNRGNYTGVEDYLTITDTTTGETETNMYGITWILLDGDGTNPLTPTVLAKIEEHKVYLREKAATIADGAEVAIVSETVSDPEINETATQSADKRTSSVYYKKADNGVDHQKVTEISGEYRVYWTVSVNTTATYASPHEHEMTEHPGAQATCTEAGNLPYYSCDICGKYFIDDAGENEIVDHNEVVLPALGHDWGAWQVVREATEEADGLRTHKCTRCDATEDEVIPKLNPSKPEPVNPEPGKPEQSKQDDNKGGNPGGQQGGNPGNQQGGNPGGGTPAMGEPASIAWILATAGGALVALTRKRRR